MTEKSQAEMEQLHNSVVDFGRFALTMLRESIAALESDDRELALKVAGQKQGLIAQFVPLEEAYFQYLALYHPVARDMRECVTSIRIIYNLERIGRMGFDIAETNVKLSSCCELYDSTALVSMGKKVIMMIDDALTAYDERSTKNITSMGDRDKEIDGMYCKVLTGYIRQMQDEKDAVPILTRYVIIDRYLERCGDQACNMAEMIVYMVTGERVEIK
jgi:phosphate transport system protein